MERIGEYLVKRLVGEGGMGKVYEAEERLTQRRVALKVLRPELTRTDEGRRLFLNEMQILAHLEHPGIVRSLASIEQDGQLVMVLEFLEGRTLRDELVARGRLTWQEAVEIVAKMAEALVVAHGQEPPIIHRDLKPENVMLTLPQTGGASASDRALAAGRGLKVMDFGIAKMLQAAHATNTQSIGTLQYMSPEQIDAQTIDTRSDLYSLGLIFYEALAGEPPFRSASPRELLNLQCSSAPPELTEEARRGLPRSVEGLLFDLLEKSPAARPATAQQVVDRLAAFRASADGRTRPGPAPSPLAASLPTGTGSRAAETTGAASSSQTKSGLAGETEAREEKEPKAEPRRRAGTVDTIALVEKATAPKQVPTAVAVLAIVVLSIVAGLATYAFRMRAGAPADPAATTTAKASPAVNEGAARGPARE